MSGRLPAVKVQDVSPDNAPEVSVRATSTLLLYFEHRYGAERLAKLWRDHGFSLGLDYMRTPTNYVSLRFLERVAVALREASGDSKFMREAGLFTASPQALGFVFYMLRAFGSPRACYKQTIDFSPSYNRVGAFTVDLLEHKRLKLSYRSSIPEQNRNICELRMGQFASFPTIWGLTPADVKETECQVLGGEACRYHLTWTDPPTMWGHYLGLLLGMVTGLLATHLGWGDALFSVTSLGVGGFALGGWLDRRRELQRKDELLSAQAQANLGSLRELQQRYDEVFGSNVALEDRVAARTRELSEANEKLEAALIKQREQDRLKTEFFDNVSHELRTPLTLILLSLDALQKEPESLPTVVRQHLTTLDRSTQRLLRLIDNLLNLAQLEAGKVRLRYQSLELHTFLTSQLLPFRTVAEKQGLTLTLEGGPLTPVSVDVERIEGVFHNLVSNALKFTPAGGSIAVRLREDATDVHVEVVDTGQGMAPADLAVIFDRFAQADTSGTRRFGGSGIGLALVKETLELHSGGIEVSSTPGQGSSFRVRLPKSNTVVREDVRERRVLEPSNRRERRSSGRFATVLAATVSGAQRPTEPQDHSRADAKAPRILVVEDDAEIRAFIADILAPSYQVLEAANGEEGVRRAMEDRPDLVVSDVMMPVLSGLNLLVQLRAHAQTVDLPVILLTARQEVSAKVEALGAGANDYLGKPFSPRELLARVETQLRLREAAVRAAENERLAAIGLLTSGFAHEVRNPLNGLMNALMPLKDVLLGKDTSGDPDLGPAMLEVMEECGQRIRHLAESLLSFVRTADKPVSVRLDQALDSTLNVLGWRIPPGVVVERAYHATDPIWGDPGTLNQVWLNLLDNALRAVGETGRVRVATTQENDDAVVTIVDSGVGIRPEDLERLFQPFFSTRAAGEGTGLGLALSRRIVLQHGGRIHITSQVGQGTRVEVRLPMRPLMSEPLTSTPTGGTGRGRWTRRLG
ncbi:ATP-binding protein [Corallococcus terminator]|uniref:histidine kinase n=1 Tax=Corallococcus terminator TaxID=2316733 RepID=A0A3A8ITG5_9BACT|nr:ATP-binding protein [Corallococcus terminator]RKG85846.1 response regulator [Corallococcus terminator]